jgi:phospholipase/carboxylesterase
LVLLHGRGGSVSDMLELAKNFPLQGAYLVAPVAANHTLYQGPFMEPNEPWLHAAVDLIQQVIEKTAQYIPKSQIILMGFSQGACLALETTARKAEKYKGIIAFSGGLIGPDLNTNRYAGRFSGTPVFIGISEHDPHVPLQRESKTLLEKQGASVILQVYPGSSHTVTQHEIVWVKRNIFSAM